jgi:RNA polymerase sigma-70 factor, ECF subfamily
VYLTEEPDDAALVEKAAAGDERAFEALVLRYEGKLFRVALRMLGEYDEAKDATQAAFIKAYLKLETFDRQFRFFSWIYRILLNECLNRRRNRRPHEPIAADLVAAGTPLEALEASERRRRVQEAVMTLAVDYREVIILRHFADMSYDDIATTLGIPEKTVKSRLYTARQRLMELLLEEKSTQ